MPSDYGVIICDTSRVENAGSVGRSLLGTTTKTWQKHTMDALGNIAAGASVKSTIACDGNFTGHVLILMHGNYNVLHTTGNLYVEEPKGVVTNYTRAVIDYVNALFPVLVPPPKNIYIHACGQGRDPILAWWRAAGQFNSINVWCPCTTSMMAGSIDKNDIKTKFNLI
ncbi:hypothetical protein KV580_25775 [Pseudomonas chlororaphis]|nr:hypothetical protein [Pseudomonas chlororaphis]